MNTPQNSASAAIVLLAGDAGFAGTLGEYLSLHLENPVLRELPPQKTPVAAVIADGKIEKTSDAPWICLLEENETPPAGATVIRTPFRLAELLETVTRIVAGAAKSEGEIRLTETCVFVPAERLLRDAKGEVGVTEKEGEMLRLLASRKGEWVKGEELLKDVWGYGDAITTHTLQTHVYRLRQKIAPLCGENIIESAPGVYRLVRVPSA